MSVRDGTLVSAREGLMAQIGEPITAAQQSDLQPCTRYHARTTTSEVAQMWFTTVSISDNKLAKRLKHEGIRAGEIIAYRAWRVIDPGSFSSGDDRLHSVFMQDYVWHPDEPASGDVRTHGI